MPQRKSIDSSALEAMIAKYEAGFSFESIARGAGCAKNTVRKYLIAAGVEVNRSRSISRAMTGKPGARRGARHTAAARAKMSQSLMGRSAGRVGPHSDETRARISAALLGQHTRYSDSERMRVEALRQVCKRSVRRLLEATGARKNTPTQQLLGYGPRDLSDHLGEKPPGAHVDHIVPIAEFVRRGIFDPAVVNALPNLRWLGADENRRKSASVPDGADELISRCLGFARGEMR